MSEFVEKDDDAQDITGGDMCQSCGCDGSDHIRVEVVGK